MITINLDESPRTEEFKMRLYSEFGFGAPKFRLKSAPYNSDLDYIIQYYNEVDDYTIYYNRVEAGASKNPTFWCLILIRKLFRVLIKFKIIIILL